MSQSTNPTVEATDRQILELLAKDGRMSYTDLGRATGLSTSAVHQRVKRLEQRGLIERQPHPSLIALLPQLLTEPGFIYRPSTETIRIERVDG